MIQVLYELAESHSNGGTLRVQAPSLVCDLQITPEVAQRRANGYLTSEVAMSFRPGDPVLVWQERPIWRMSVFLHLRYWGAVATLASIDVDATTGVVIPLSSEQITTMQDRADAIASRLTPETAPAI